MVNDTPQTGDGEKHLLRPSTCFTHPALASACRLVKSPIAWPGAWFGLTVVWLGLALGSSAFRLHGLSIGLVAWRLAWLGAWFSLIVVWLGLVLGFAAFRLHGLSIGLVAWRLAWPSA
ncbi:MAG: hypothetical protein K8963_00230, partial [Proteobacteria bacterium]|nr:hypothetical protein [Pseudomonadota bacterium]